jgi:predicted Zn-dependent protease with MMP-like domain
MPDLDALLDAIDDALAADDLETALRLAREAARDYPQEPDAHVRLGDALWDTDDLRGARAAYEKAVQLAPDWDEALGSLAWVQYALLDFDAAQKTAERARSQGDDPSAWALLGRLAERAGRLDEADRCARRAHALDPDSHPLPCRVTEAEFRAAVAEALDRLPDEFRDALDGEVAVLVEPVPAVDVLRGDDPPFDPEILGLYVGTPLPERADSVGSPRLPDVVYLFQRNIEHESADRDELVEQIAITVYHEIGHYLGYDDEELDERGFG